MKALISTAIVFIFLTFCWVFYYCAFLNHIDVNEIGIAYDSSTGKITIQEDSGWYRTGILTTVVPISTKPFRVTIPSDANVIVCKYVRFRKEGALEFVRMQGHHYQMNDRLQNIFLGYAFSGNKYEFLEEVQGAAVENSVPLNK